MSRIFTVSLIALLTHVSSASAETVTPIDDPAVTEDSMASLLAGPGVTVSGATYSTSYLVNEGPWYNPDMQPNKFQAGEFSGYSFLLGSGFDAGVILSTGNVTSVLGPNDSVQTSRVWSNSSVNDPDLGSGIYDVVKFSFDVVPENEVLVIDFTFGSDEYLEYVGDAFNDLARVIVNGTNCALTPAGDEVSINNIHSTALPPPIDGRSYPNNNDGISNSGIYVDNASAAFNTEMDGFTRRLSCRVAVVPGQTVNVVTGLADAGDAQLDSWILFRADSIRSEPVADYGDAPDSYGTLAASGGAAHDIVEGVRLGAVGVSGDLDGFDNGIDYSQGLATDDDDNALTVVPNIGVTDTTYGVTFDATSINGSESDVAGWIDFDRDGQFQADEAAPLVRVTSGAYETPVTLSWSGLGSTGPDVVSGPTYMRLRIANLGLTSSTPVGAFATGEVEDYRLIISDGLAPSVSQITRQMPLDEVTNAEEVTFRVAYSEYVENVDVTDFSSSAGSVSAVTSVSDSVYDVTVSGLATYEGTVALEVVDTSDVVDAEGNALSSPVAASSETYTLDHLAPSAPVVGSVSDDTGESAVDGITSDGTLLIAGLAEPGSDVAIYINGVVAGTATADGSGSWNFDYSGTELTDGSYDITALVTDAAGNSSDFSATYTLIVDSEAPVQPQISGVSDDSGVSSTDGITNDNTLILSGVGTAGDSVGISVNGTPVTTVIVDASGNWSFDYSSVTLADGTYNFVATSTDTAGNTSAPATYTAQIDTQGPQQPAITSVSDDSGTDGDGVTNDSSLLVSGQAGAGDQVTVVIDGSPVGTATADASGNWTFDYTSTALNDGDYVLTAQVTDEAGNLSASESFTLAIDTVAPSTPVVSGITNDTGSDSADGVTSDNTLVIRGTADPDAVIDVLINGVSAGTTTVASDGSWALDYSAVTLADGTYSVIVTASDLAGNTSADSEPLNVTVDTTTPASASLLGISADTGVAGDNVTSDNTLLITGTAEPESTVEVYVDGALTGSVSTDASGNWTYDYTGTVLPDGDYEFSAVAIDGAGNSAPESTALNVSIDTLMPSAPAVTGVSDDTGIDNSDGITSDNTLTISGTAEAQSEVTLFIDGAAVSTVTADAAGLWQLDYSSTALSDGAYLITASSSDAAGNESAISAAFALTVDTQAPVAASVTGISDDTGVPGDNQTADSTLIISGTAEPGAQVDVYVDGAPVVSVTADVSGNWTYDYSATPLPDGDYEITAIAQDSAGNTAPESAPLTVSVDATPPSAPVIAGITDDSGADATDGVTSDNTLLFHGSAEAETLVALSLNGSLIGSVTADASGVWQLDYTSTPLSEGNYSLTATASDDAGNESASSAEFTLLVDTTAPSAAVVAEISEDTGIPGDYITSDNTLMITGTSEPGAEIDVLINGVSAGTVVADASGDWTFDYTGTALNDGDYVLTTTVTDLAGNVSPVSAPVTVMVDTAAPAAAVVTSISEDTGTVGDFETTDNTLLISGTAEAGALVDVYVNGVIVDTVAADTNGTWTLDYSGTALADGDYQVTATVRDDAGNTAPESAPVTLSVDATAPATPSVDAISADTGADNTDGITSDTSLEFSGTAEPGAQVVVLLNGVAVGSVIADSSGNWILDYTDTELSDGSYAVTATASDTAGNNSDESAPLSIEVDQTAPEAPVLTGISEDSATVGDGITSDSTLVLQGTAEPDSLVELSVNGVAIATVTAANDGNWTYDYSGTVLADGEYAFTALSTDTAGNLSATSDALDVVVDTTVPTAPAVTAISDDTGVAGDGITSDNTLLISGTAEPLSEIEVSIASTSGTTILGTVIADSNGAWTIDNRASVLADDSYQVTATATDAAGNASALSQAYALTVDTSGPETPVVNAVSEDTGVADGITSDTTLIVSGTAGSDVTVTLYIDATPVATTTSDSEGNWSVDYSATALAEGTYQLSAQAETDSGLISPMSVAYDVTVDTTAPLAPSVTAVTDDTGAGGDQTTSDNTLIFSGNAEPGTDIDVLVDGALVGMVKADSEGNWSLDYTSVQLPDGLHTLSAKATDTAGNQSPESASLTLTIDTQAPELPVLSGISDDTGASAADSITADTTLIYVGTAEPDSLVSVLLDGTLAGTATADAAGQWSLDATVSELADGVYQVTVRSEDLAGNTSDSAPQQIVIDTTAPGVAELTSISDDTATPNDQVTSDNTLMLSGISEPGSTVELFVNGSPVGTALTDNNGDWSFDNSAIVLSDGENNVTTQVTDLAGNTGVVSAPSVITVDTLAPDAPVISGISEDTGAQDDDAITTDNTIAISGTAEAGAEITLYLDGSLIGNLIADTDGQWEFSYEGTVLADGEYVLTSTATDVAGNLSAISDGLEITIDTADPDAVTLAQDGQTIADNTPVLSGTAEAGSLITVTLDGNEYSTTTDVDGNWTLEVTNDVANGTYPVLVISEDSAGNRSETSGSVTLDVSVSADNSSTSAAPLTVLADGTSPSVITVEVRDTAGDPVSGITPVISTNLGTLTSVTETDTGVYTAELTSQFATGTATLTISVAGTELTPLQIEFTPADGDGDGLTDLEEDTNGDGDPTNDDLDRDGTPDYLDDDDDGDGKTTTEEDVNGDGDPTNDDSDGDGIPDYLDGDDDSTDGNNDSDGDGVPDDVECSSGLPCEDTDGDGIPDYMDEDDDNDGVPSVDEGTSTTEAGQPLRDSDGDGIPDYRDNDDDDDGLLTSDEDDNSDADGNPATAPGPDEDGDGIPAYLDPNDADTGSYGDSDGDGIPDDQECSALPCEDTDADGIPDYRDGDDDGDGIPTADEGAPLRDTDGNGTPDYLDPDDDGDGIPSNGEDSNTDGDANPATTPGPDADNDGIPAYLDVNDGEAGVGDGDGDGIPDDVECSALPCADTDGDGIPDFRDEDDDGDGIPTADEGAPLRDSDGNGTPDYLDADDDGDGIPSVQEDADSDLDGNPATNPGIDADGDGIPAYLDVNDDQPGAGDGDGDGVADDVECSALPCKDSDNDGIPDYRDNDDDGDGVPTADEGAPLRDSDGDGSPDYLDPDDDGDGIGTPVEDADTDNDGNPATNAGPDADNDGIPAYLDPNDAVSSNPGDGDGDGIPDDQECPTGIPCVDSDLDGIPDYMDGDDDGDGIPTSEEDADTDNDGNPATNPGPDGDGDGVPDYLDPDTTDDDGDGLTNQEEDANGDGNPDNDDLDGDGIPDYLDPDDDGDGRTTQEEDLNGNGDPRDDDADNDGIPAYLDPNDELNGSPGDADGDGILDDIECETGLPCRDTDGDGLPDYMDEDDDGDGVPSSIEGNDRDTDNDGIPDYRDPDDDGDGASTASEDGDTDGDGNPSTNAGPDDDGDTIPAYLDPNDADAFSPGDSDGDGLSDADECQAGAPCEDSDADGQPDYNDPDDDNDGRQTVSEDPDADGNPANDDTDGDGIPDYLDRDDDGDGIPSDQEGNGDADSDGIPDYLDPDGNSASGTGGDSDDDGISDVAECPTGIPCRDSDNDGTPDYADPDDDNDGRSTVSEGPDRDTDGDGIPDYRDPDDDGDGFDTRDEGNGDSDNDGIPDYLDPSAGDSDEDGVPDGAECPDGVPCRDTDSDGVPDYLDDDDDGDGIPTVDEDTNGDGTPTGDDTDGDGIPDYLDRDDDGDGVPSDGENAGDNDNDGIPDYLDPDDSNEAATPDGSGDSDRDGASDAEECPTGVPCRDTDGNGTPDYLSPDDDGDGIPTVDEDRNNDGTPLNDDTDSDGRPDYRDPDDDGDGINTIDEGDGDSDFDNVPDYLDPSGGDSDRDGIPDSVECPGLILCWDTDGDGTPNLRDPDDDGDGVPTIFEDPDGDGTPRNDDTDNDGIPDYLDTDDDNDGINTGSEGGVSDADNDGIPDYRDPDSTNAGGMPDGSGDSDGDGISDLQECGSGPACADSDNDGTPDYMQVGSAADQAPGLVDDVVGKGQVSSALPALGGISLLWVLLALPLVVVRRGTAERFRRRVLIVVTLMLPVASWGAPEINTDDIYAGGGLGVSRLTPGTTDSVYSNVDDSGIGFQLFGGYRLSDDLSAELQYAQLGEATLKDSTTDEEAGFGYSVLGAMLHWYPWQISWNGKDSVNAYLEAGLVNLTNDSDVDFDQEASMSLGLGLGVEYSFQNSWAARLSAQSYTRDAHFLAVSVTKRFGAAKPVPVKRPVVKPEPVPEPEPVVEPVIIMADSDDDGIVDDIDDCPGTPQGMSVNHRGCSVLDARLEGVYFASGSAELTRGSEQILNQLTDTLLEHPRTRVEIGAYTDSMGAAANNLRLSERRATAVMQYLIDMGINPARLEARGYGENDPIASNDTPQGRAQNRRVEIRIID